MLDFKNVKGKAEKSGPPRIKFADGVNRFRMLGGILPMYVYWIPLADGSGSVPLECLAFDREKEQFTNMETDWVRHYFPDLKCSWSYKGLAIDRTDGQIKAVDHKKKLLGDIISFAEGPLGDPTHPDTGWDIVVNRQKTGPLAFNVEYKLEFGQLKATPLTDEEKAAYAEFPSLEDYFKRPTPEEQKKFIEEKCLEDTGASSESTDDLPEEFQKDEDVPF